AVADDATADRENGIDRDGRFNLSWSYPSSAASVPCGYRVEETRPTASGTIWLDDAEELMLDAGNSKWDSATGWTTRPHPNTLSLGYGAVYTDDANATITTKTAIALPPALITLTFESFEDLEVDFDYGHVDVSDDGGASWRELATYNGAFSGVRSVDLSPFAGKAVKLRFRLTSDGGVSMPAYQGWWIDDIRIQAGASFNAIATLPSSTTSLAIGGKQDGTYAYRVVALFDNCVSNPFATTPSNIQQVTVQISTRPPMAAFTSSANPSESAQSVTFDASASADQDQVGSNPGIASYQWSFGDGATATTAVATHAYTSPGTYRVALTVVDEEGESANTESLQTVHDPNANVFGGGSANVVDFGVNASNLGNTANGDFTWNDMDTGLNFESVRITRVERSGNKATIYGDCTKNKTQTLPFVLTLIDRGTTGDIVNLDAGSYSGGGIVNDGNVTVQP
ncbi:MAG TPA: PKD domain-containing protein, partial [Thermoanaerobaculia bacterium]|nr:PKD domain-containing protein [Thermoanaerobaculia bacterium]